MCVTSSRRRNTVAGGLVARQKAISTKFPAGGNPEIFVQDSRHESYAGSRANSGHRKTILHFHTSSHDTRLSDRCCNTHLFIFLP